MARIDPLSVDRLIERILDGKPLDSSTPDISGAGSSREIEALQTVSDIARAFRRFDSAPQAAPAPVLFEWGHLLVLEKVAVGGSSEVFRAWDAGLGTHVALKLLRTDVSSTRAGDFLREARRLAKVRHHNVLSVYGAASHAGRPGLWCEWIEGQSLARMVRESGPLGSDEAVVLGITLCRALGVVHAAGLLHGDVKPENVLRERGGRMVLVDFGAGGDPTEVNARLRNEATPAWLAPEVLDGALRTLQQDLFALGGLLQFVLNAQVPDPTRLGADLKRADISPALRAVLERARSAQPEERFRTAAEMERALADCLLPTAPPRARSIRRPAFIAAGALFVLLGVFFFWRWAATPPLDAEVNLQRQRGDVVETIADGASLVLGDRLHFTVRPSAKLWLYVYSADDQGQLQQVFPLSGLDAGNPLQAGRSFEIPGTAQGRAMRLEVTSSAAAEEFILVAAAAPIERLESHPDTGQTAAQTPVRGTRLVSPARFDHADTHLDALAEELAALSPAPRIWRFRLPHHETRPAN